MVDAYGMLAVSLDRRSAADELHLSAGDEVRLSRLDDDSTPTPSVTTAVAFPTARS